MLRYVGGLILLLLASATAAPAQPPVPASPLLAMLIRGVASPEEVHVVAFREALRERGWIEGRNLRVEVRYAGWRDEQLEPLAAELLRLNPDVVWTYTQVALRTVAGLTRTVPTVCASCGFLVEAGLAQSLARPGGNVTGIEAMSGDLEPKRLEVLRAAVPGLRRIGILGYVDRRSSRMMRSVEDAAANLGLEVAYARAVAPAEIEGAIAALVRDRARAILVQDGPLFTQERASIAAAALRSRVPTISNVPGFAEAGGLLQYGTDILDQFRRSARYVDGILRGAKASDLPIEQSTRIELTVNLKTARALGLTIPPTVSNRAGRLINP